MPDPCNVWSEHPNLPPGIDNDEHLKGLGSKKCGITWMEQKAQDRREAKRILIVGGGALGIRKFRLHVSVLAPSILLAGMRTRWLTTLQSSRRT